MPALAAGTAVMLFCLNVLDRRVAVFAAAQVAVGRALPQMHWTSTQNLGDVEREEGDGNELSGETHERKLKQCRPDQVQRDYCGTYARDCK